MNIFFIRHGDPDYDNDCLTEKGRDEGSLLAPRAERLNIDLFYSSPQGRAKETASFCMKKDTPLTIHNWLRELEWGDLKGNAYSTAGPWVKTDNFLKNYHSYPEGDSWMTHPEIVNDRLVGDVKNRIEQFETFLEEMGYQREGQGYLVQTPSDKNIAFFCHGGITTALVSHMLNIPFWTYVAHFPMAMTGITKIALDGGKDEFITAKADFINDYHHLKDN